MMRKPPGFSSFSARRLISLYPESALGIAALALGERRRIEHDRVERFAHALERPQLVEHVRGPGLHVRQAVPRRVAGEQRGRILRDVERRQLVDVRGELQ